MPANILIIENEPSIQELIVSSMRHAGQAVIRADSIELAAQLINASMPHVVVLASKLAGISSVEYVRHLRGVELSLNLPIIVLTENDGEHDIFSFLGAGADDCLAKPFSSRELVARIRAVLRRRAPQLAEGCMEVEGLHLDPVAHRIFCNGQALALGMALFRLLHFLMLNAERVHSRQQLLEHVWGDHIFIKNRTVDVHIHRLRSSLEATGHDRLIQAVRGFGYRFSTQMK